MFPWTRILGRFALAANSEPAPVNNRVTPAQDGMTVFSINPHRHSRADGNPVSVMEGPRL